MSVHKTRAWFTLAHRQMSMPKPMREPEHGDRHSLGRPRAQTPQKQHAGLLERDAAAIRSQHPLSLRGRRGRPLPWCGELTFRTPTRHRAPNKQPGRILIPGDGATGDQGAQNRPTCPAMAATRTPAAYPANAGFRTGSLTLGSSDFQAELAPPPATPSLAMGPIQRPSR
jgi:hypothetical protein